MKSKVVFLPINKIKLDPNQPRKTFSEKTLTSLAKSMKTEGLIHPIEVDKDHVIIVGEYRYRAAKFKLNWDKIKVIINAGKFSPYKRLRRQMAENLHQSGSKGGGESMNPLETSDGWVRLYELRSGKKYTPGEHFIMGEKGGPGRGIKGAFLEIAEEVGIPKTTVWEYLKLQEQPRIVKKALEKGLPRTYIREADRAPIEVRDKLKEKIAKGEYKSRVDVARVVKIAKTKPDLALIELEREREKESKAANVILNRAIDLGLAMERNPLSAINPAEKKIVIGQLGRIAQQIKRYINGKHIIHKIKKGGE